MIDLSRSHELFEVMIISSRRNPPRMSLRRTPSSNTLTAGLQSPGQSRTTTTTTTTKTTTFLAPPLADSPLPSPVLPSIIPSYGKRRPGSARRKAIRLMSWLVMMFGLLQMALWLIRVVPQVVRQWAPSLSPVSLLDGSYRLVEQLPDVAAPVVVVSRWGRRKWTLWIPGVPSPSEIEDLCAHCVEASRELSNKNESNAFDYDHRDPNYLEVADAQRMGILRRGPRRRRSSDKQSGICESSLTFVLQSDEAGMGNTLLYLWLSYGLAQQQGRSFFIDDRNWAYGRYSTYFAPPPLPRCRPPPVPQRVPCPLQAKHLVVSAASAPYVFGEEFHRHYRRHGKSSAEQQRRVFELARAGYEALFHLSPNDAMYLQRREQQLDQETHQHGGVQIGIHVRRGDLHPLESLYRESYLPLERYAEEARNVLRSVLVDSDGLFSSYTGGHQQDDDADVATTTALSSRMIVASDDPEVYNAPELQGAVKAQSYIWLASKSALEARRDSSAPPPPVDNAIGWEGGFFKDMFWSLGTPHIRHVITDKPSADKWRELQKQSTPAPPPPPSPPSSPDPPPPPPLNPLEELKDIVRANSASHRYNPSANVLALRELVGRAYLLDIAVLAQTDHVICGISTVTCRLLAVMMGWDRAIAEGAWHNIDGGWDWMLTIP